MVGLEQEFGLFINKLFHTSLGDLKLSRRECKIFSTSMDRIATRYISLHGRITDEFYHILIKCMNASNEYIEVILDYCIVLYEEDNKAAFLKCSMRHPYKAIYVGLALEKTLDGWQFLSSTEIDNMHARAELAYALGGISTV